MLTLTSGRSIASLRPPFLDAIPWLHHAVGRPLPRLAEVHPGPPGGGRWVGLASVPVMAIRGTAGSADRAADFLPRRGHEPADWRWRWTRLEAAARRQAILPPIQVLKTGDEYWVIDGHNRVALARETGQVWIDADVTEVDLPPPPEAG